MVAALRYVGRDLFYGLRLLGRAARALPRLRWAMLVVLLVLVWNLGFWQTMVFSRADTQQLFRDYALRAIRGYLSELPSGLGFVSLAQDGIGPIPRTDLWPLRRLVWPAALSALPDICFSGPFAISAPDGVAGALVGSTILASVLWRALIGLGGRALGSGCGGAVPQPARPRAGLVPGGGGNRNCLLRHDWLGPMSVISAPCATRRAA